jgi:pimeloyl-ACP methyl ester carboxylesterase
MWLDVAFGLLISYIVVSFFVFIGLNTNVVRRSKNYVVELPARLEYLENPKLAVWIATEENRNKNVILLHGFTRNSGKMSKRGMMYWNRGYNVYLIDNLGHGKSGFTWFPSGIRYHIEVKRVIDKYKIDSPILHGVSMGAIAGSYISQKASHYCKLIVCEALPAHFNTLYRDLMRYFKIPYYPFFWVGKLSKLTIWKQFAKNPLYTIYENLEYIPWEGQSPKILIHSDADKLFLPHKHFDLLVNHMKDNANFLHWLVPNASHSKMDLNPDYEEKLFHMIQQLSYPTNY